VIKFIVAALWISAVTAGAIFYSFQQSEAKVTVEPEAPLLGGLDYIKTDIMSVPVLSNGGITGYFLARLVYTIEPAVEKKMSVPAATLINDELYSFLYSSPMIDFSKTETIDLDAFRNQIRDRVNKRVGEDVVHEVLVEQIDYLSKEEIRDNNLRRRKEANAETLAGGAEKAKSGGHGTAAKHGEAEPADGEAPAH